MKNRIFSRSIQILIVGLLIALAAFRNQWAAIAVASVWLLFTVGRLFFGNRRRIAHWLKKAMPQQQMQPNVDAEPQAFQPPQMMVVPEVSDSPSHVLLRHLNCRISDKLKSAYPDVTWNWAAEQPEQIASKGGTARIKLDQADEFTHVEVTVDQLARIEFSVIQEYVRHS